MVIKIEDIPEIVRILNLGINASAEERLLIPEGVLKIGIDKKSKVAVYDYIYFPELGVYKVDEIDPIQVLTNEDYLIQTGHA